MRAVHGQRVATAACSLVLALSLALPAPATAQAIPVLPGVVSDIMRGCAFYAKPAIAQIRASRSYFGVGVVRSLPPTEQEARQTLVNDVIFYAVLPDQPGLTPVRQMRAFAAEEKKANVLGEARFAECAADRRAQQIAADSRAHRRVSDRRPIRACAPATVASLAPPSWTISVNQCVSGTLTADDTVLNDGSHVDRYRLHATAGLWVEARMIAPDYSPLPVLKRAGGATNDIPTGYSEDGAHDMLFYFRVPETGDYEIWASAVGKDFGPYTLALTGYDDVKAVGNRGPSPQTPGTGSGASPSTGSSSGRQPGAGAGAGAGAGSVGTPAPSSTVTLPRPAAGVVPSPVIMGATTSGATSGTIGRSTFAAASPAAWKTRALTLPSALAALRPTDAILDRFPDGSINIFMGRNHDAAAANEAKYISGRNATSDPANWTSCSQLLGRTTVSWFVMLQVAHQLPPEWTQAPHYYSNAFVCGGATIEEAIAAAYDLAKTEAAGRPFSTFLLQAGVTAEADYDRLRQEGRLLNGARPAALAPWSFTCDMPLSLDEAQGVFMPQDPGSGPAFAKYVMSLPERREYSYAMPAMDRKSTYTKTQGFGCHGYWFTPEPNQGPPVFAPR